MRLLVVKFWSYKSTYYSVYPLDNTNVSMQYVDRYIIVSDFQTKCMRYWPEKEGTEDTHGLFTIQLIDSHVFADYVIHTLHVAFKVTSNTASSAGYRPSLMYTVWRLTKLTQNDEEYSPARTINERIMTRECASSYADRHPGDVK